MKQAIPPAITHSWSLSGTIPDPDQKYPRYGGNIHIGVTATSMEKAMEAARLVYPEIKFFGIHHRGEVNIIGQ